MSNLSRFRRARFPEMLFDDSYWGNLFAFGGPTNADQRPVFQPDTRLSETDEMYVYSLAVPGLAREDLDVQINERTLTVSYEQKEEQDTNVFAQSFQISRTIPKTVNLDKVDAKMENGVLNMILPKKVEPQRAPRTIEIK